VSKPPEVALSKRTYGILAGVIGSAVGAWWWSRQYAMSMQAESNNDRGTVIFHNTPTPTPLSEEGVI
jgi:Na+/glutamate symporter